MPWKQTIQILITQNAKLYVYNKEKAKGNNGNLHMAYMFEYVFFM